MQPIVLGTAQWGSSYGITNRQGRPDDDELLSIIQVAESFGVTTLDTAAAYGDAEARIRPWASLFAISTKISGRPATDISARLEAALHRLGVPSLEACLIHDWDTLTEGEKDAAAVALEELRDRCLTRKVGVSTYDDSGLAAAARMFDTLDVVQVPLSVLDQRLAESGALASLRACGVTIQARSIFLQGLLLEEDLPERFRHPDLTRFRHYCERAGLSPIDVALTFVRSNPVVGQVVIGAARAAELKEILGAWASLDCSTGTEGLPALASSDVDLIDPRRWKA